MGCCFHRQGIVLTITLHPNLLHLQHWQADSMSPHFLGLPKTKPGGWNNTVLWPDHHMQSCPGEETMLTQPHPATTILSLGGSSPQASEHSWEVSVGSNSVLRHQKHSEEDIQSVWAEPSLGCVMPSDSPEHQGDAPSGF